MDTLLRVPTLSPADIASFRAGGHVTLRSVFSPAAVAELGDTLAEIVGVHSPDELVRRAPERQLWKRSAGVASFVFDPLIREIATTLLGCANVRLIHDAYFAKAGRVKGTPWHRDSDFWSITGGGALTLWIPLQDTPESMALRYATGSHLGNTRLLRRFEKVLVPVHHKVTLGALNLGDVGIHYYKTLHGSMRYVQDRPRRSLAIHLVDADARVGLAQTSFHALHNAQSGWDTLQPGDRLNDTVAPAFAA